MTWLLFFLLSTPIPPPPKPPQPPAQALEFIQRLGCECSRTQRGVMECQKLPEFGDNEWTHSNPKEFIMKGKLLAAQLAEMSPRLSGRYQLALQGSADSREIIHVKTFGEVSLECRSGHTKEDRVSNRDLAFLRACELRRLFPPSLVPNVKMFPPIDYTNPKMRNGPRKAYEGEQYKAVALLIVSDDRSLCGDVKHSPK